MEKEKQRYRGRRRGRGGVDSEKERERERKRDKIGDGKIELHKKKFGKNAKDDQAAESETMN